MARVAVTGGTGFVGSNLVRRLLADGHEVHLLNRPGHRDWRIQDLLARLRIHELDLASWEATRARVLDIRPEQVFHLAAHGAYSWETDPHQIVRTNYLSTVNLVLASEEAGTRAFVNAGSSSEYGYKDRPTRETDCPEPNSDYAAAKAAATLFCQQRGRRSGRPTVTLRLYSVYGPYEEPNRLIPKLLTHGLAGKLPPLTSPRTARDFVYVDDVVDALVLAADRPHQDAGAIYNIGSGEQTRLESVVALAREMFGITAEPTWGSMADRAWDTSVWSGDVTRAEQELGWKASTALPAGLQRFSEWLRGAEAARYALPG